jgi:hypothetical protein
MAMSYSTNNLVNNPYSVTPVVVGEPDMRAELTRLLHIEKRGSFYIYRRVRRDADGFPIIADSSLTNRSAEPTYGTNKGMKYLFDDYMVIGYRSEGTTFHEHGKIKDYGDSRTDAVCLFVEYDFLYKHTNNLQDISDEFDKVIIPVTDINGNVISPLRIQTQFDIGSVEPYRLDGFGRVEFFKINLDSNFDNSIQI